MPSRNRLCVSIRQWVLDFLRLAVDLVGYLWNAHEVPPNVLNLRVMFEMVRYGVETVAGAVRVAKTCHG